MPRCFWYTAAVISGLSNTKFESTGKGLTFKDLMRGRNKREVTPKQAQNILKYHKKEGNLYVNSPITIPQQYFASKEQAELSANLNKQKSGGNKCLVKSSTHPDPTGVPDIDTSYENEYRAENIFETIRMAVNSSASGKIPLPIVFHNIRIHVKLNNQSEAYYERLNYKNNSNVYYTKHANQEKRLETRIDGYLIRASVFPKGKLIITIPCSDRPLPIIMDSASRMSGVINGLTNQIRYFLINAFRDFNCQIVPPVHTPSAWVLIHSDINFDVPTTTLNFLNMVDIQITQVDDIIFRVYKKLLDAKPFIRFEEGTHPFRNAQLGTDDIGPIVISAAEDLAQRVAMVEENDSKEEEAQTDNDVDPDSLVMSAWDMMQKKKASGHD